MKRVLMVCSAVLCFLATAMAVESSSRTPAEWVTRLGADHLAERDEASAALLELGPAARETVRDARNSPDAEVQWRARELWKTLRWQVVPGANDDVRALMDAAAIGKANRAIWRDFVKKHGAQSVRLAAMCFKEKVLYNNVARYAVIEDADPDEVAQVIAHAGSERQSIEEMLDALTPDKAARITALNLMKIEIDLWKYEQAFDFGREVLSRIGDDEENELGKQCTIAADRGKLTDHVEEIARKDISAETDNGKLCKRLAFYVTLFTSLGKKDDIAALCDLAKGIDASPKHAGELRPLIESLMKAGLQPNALKLLSNASGSLALYMRSGIESQMHATDAAGEDWKAAVAALDNEKEKDAAMYGLADLMLDWHDKRAGEMFQKLLDMDSVQPIYGANACFRLAGLAEEGKQYIRAADLYEKGLALSAKTGGILFFSRHGKNDGLSGEDVIRNKIKEFRERSGVPSPTPIPTSSPEPQRHPKYEGTGISNAA